MNERKARVLLIEEDAGDARLIQDLLAGSGADYELIHEAALKDGLERAARDSVDAVILALTLPDGSGLDFVALAHKRAPHLPLLVITGTDDLGPRAVEMGADDYLVRGGIGADLLRRALRYSIERHHLREELRRISLFDDLTGLYNRRGFLSLAEQEIKAANRSHRPLLLLFADMDNLKQINDTYGHSEGDRAIRDVAAVLRSTFRKSDILARIGGDEFVVLALESAESRAAALSRRLQEQLDIHHQTNERPYQLSISIGIIPYSRKAPTTIEELLVRADAAMYREKREKRGA